MKQVFVQTVRVLICRVFLAVLFLAPVAARADDVGPPPDLSAKMEKALTERKIDERLGALAELGGMLSLPEVPKALKMADRLNSLRERVVFTEAVFKRWGELAPAEAFERIAEMPESVTKVQALRGVIPGYAKAGIDAIAAAALRMRPGRARAETVQLVAEEWARQDVQAALRWVNDLPEGFPKEGALRNVHFIWVHADPAGISSLVRDLPEGDTKTALVINVAGNWAATDAAAAIRWAESLPMETDKQTALATIAESWADTAPLDASEFARKLAPAELRQRSVLAAVERWATQDPRRAISWVADIDDPALQAQCLARILTVFVPVSPETARRCVEGLPPGPVRENAIEAYVEAARIWDPVACVRMAMKTADPATRERRVHESFRTWLSWDPESARQWLKHAGFSETVKQRWLAEKAAWEF